MLEQSGPEISDAASAGAGVVNNGLGDDDSVFDEYAMVIVVSYPAGANNYTTYSNVGIL